MTSVPQNKRVTGKEQYYTPGPIASHCFNVVFHLTSGLEKTWLEPAGGTVSFIEAMLKGGIPESMVKSFDIEPKHRLVNKTEDFLLEKLDNLEGCVTLTNPPFGRANKLSVPFFNKCAQVSDLIGFIVPKSWRKWSIINRLDRRFHLVHDEELDVNYDSDEGEGRSKGKLATVFQVWEKRDYERQAIKVEDRGYILKVPPSSADVCITVFGRGCGSVFTEFPREKNTTKMFLQVKDESVVEALRKVEFSKFYNNVAFVEALSIQEIKHLLNEYFDNLGTLGPS